MSSSVASYRVTQIVVLLIKTAIDTKLSVDENIIHAKKARVEKGGQKSENTKAVSRKRMIPRYKENENKNTYDERSHAMASITIKTPSEQYHMMV